MNIAFLGTGLMGAPMAERLLKNKLEVTCYNRTEKKANQLKKHGAIVKRNPAKAISENEIIIVMLSDYKAVENLLFYDGYKDYKGKTVIQMSTISTDENKKLEKKINKLGGGFLEAPVLGSIPQAKDGSLFVLVGGELELADEYSGLLSILGEVEYIGKVGEASATKLALNQLIATETAAFSMSLGFLLKKGIDINPFMSILRQSALYAPTFDKKLDKYIKGDFENPNFPLKHMLKDVGLIERDLKLAGVNTEIIKAIQRLLKGGVENGLGDLDYSALYKTINPDTN
ncbi:MAG: NAD(P)-dependent oxidoreductase [Bacteroidetes bacterium]|nr:NAD(P)-dependent oxidoreductase [Bacteroidota bacterium]